MAGNLVFNVNNQNKILISQGKEDGQVLATTLDCNGDFEEVTLISQGDFVMLLNYYQYQKKQGNPIF